MAILKTNFWYVEYDTEKDGTLPNGGIILRNIKHDNYNLAKEIRTTGFWIEFETFENKKSVKKESKFYPIDKTHFNYENLGKPILLDERSDAVKPKIDNLKTKKLYDKLDKDKKKKYDTYINILDNLQNFSKYHFIKGIQAKYSLKDNFSSENCEYANLTITQTYLFTDYQERPAHEPSGGLKATRLFPLIKTEFKNNTNFNDKAQKITRINSIRIDYKFHPRLDTYLASTAKNIESMLPLMVSPQLKAEYKHILYNKPQQAGVFIDEESPDVFARGKGIESVVFKAAEKPLIYEIGGVGLEKAMPFYDRKKTWDNIHWWGGYLDHHIPSAPGAFHAMHLHWRWGGAIKGNLLKAPPFGNAKQFTESGVPSAVLDDKRYKDFLGPLVHPKCWIQSIRFAIVKYDEKENNTTTKNFNDKFSDKVNNPTTHLKRINDGENLVLWYSVEIHKKMMLPAQEGYNLPSSPTTMAPTPSVDPVPAKSMTASLNGSVFIHGLFFAHEEESTEGDIGSTTEEYIPSFSRTKDTILKERKFLRDVTF